MISDVGTSKVMTWVCFDSPLLLLLSGLVVTEMTVCMVLLGIVFEEASGLAGSCILTSAAGGGSVVWGLASVFGSSA